MSTVRAAVMERPGRIAVQEFPMPEPQEGAVVMQVSYSGICGTDKHTFRGESKQYAGTAHERDLTYPLICGHENVGRIAALGGTVRDSDGFPLKVGDRIVPGANVPCGECHFCVNDYPYYFCERMEDYGNSLHCGRAREIEAVPVVLEVPAEVVREVVGAVVAPPAGHVGPGHDPVAHPGSSAAGASSCTSCPGRRSSGFPTGCRTRSPSSPR